MDVWRITLAALRRWYILLPLLGLTGWAALVAGDGIQPEYEVSATGLITPGQTQPNVANPYGGLDDANQVLGIVLNSAEARNELVEQGLAPNYTVAPQTRSTIFTISLRADDPEQAVATGAAIFELAEDELRERQTAAGLIPSSQYGLQIVDQPSVLAVVYDGKTQVQAVVGLLGASLALLAAVLFDDIVGLIRRRRRRRAAARTETGDTEEVADSRLDDQPAATAPTRRRDRKSRDPKSRDAKGAEPITDDSVAAAHAIEPAAGDAPDEPVGRPRTAETAASGSR